MKFSIKLFILLFSAAGFFTACQKENIDEIITKDPVLRVDTINMNPLIQRIRSYSSDSLILDCIRIPYPVDFVQESGDTLTINSTAELDSAIMLSNSIADFVYPFEARDNNGEILIQSIEDLVSRIIDCSITSYDCSVDSEAHILLFFNSLNILTLNKYAYEIKYPVTLVVEGNQVVVNNDDEYLPAVGGSPFDLLPTQLVYPITITQFGREIILNSDDDVCEFYDTLDEACQNKPPHIQFFFNEGPGTRISCTYFINYPVSIFLNNSSLVIESREEYLDLLNASPDAYDGISLVYPVSVFKYIDGQLISFEADAEICQYLTDCI